MKDMDSYKKGFEDALGIKEHYKFEIFGYKIDELFKAIDFYQKSKDNGLPIGFEFPFSARDSWSGCCDELRRQGWKIIKE